MGWINKIKQGLAKTREIFGGVADLFRFRGRVDQKFLDKLEEKLYLADVGTYATQEIITRVRQAYMDKEVTGEMVDFVKNQLKTMLAAPSDGIQFREVIVGHEQLHAGGHFVVLNCAFDRIVTAQGARERGVFAGE